MKKIDRNLVADIIKTIVPTIEETVVPVSTHLREIKGLQSSFPTEDNSYQ
jgi:hypothetical protein